MSRSILFFVLVFEVAVESVNDCVDSAAAIGKFFVVRTLPLVHIPYDLNAGKTRGNVNGRVSQKLTLA